MRARYPRGIVPTSATPFTPPVPGTYQETIWKERKVFENCLDVHDLPKIFHYWSEKHLRPKLLPFGFDSPHAMFVKYLAELCEQRAREQRASERKTGGRGAIEHTRFVSLGSGNCELEIELARQLRARGHESFTIDCLDLNPSMLNRGMFAAHQAGVAAYLEFTESDCNDWAPKHAYDAVIANQSLHHILNLEGLFEQVKKSLASGGCFIMSDMIGRNGHQRWPEALDAVHEFWRGLPPSYRFNLRSGRYEEVFEDWDCSTEGFEGVRSQDILPLLLRNFHFQLFVPFGNVIDPFIDRSFGHHFNPDAAWDRAFIDRVHARDESGLAAGLLTPTHMLAVVGSDAPAHTAWPGNLSPNFCVRTCNGATEARADGFQAYDWFSWPHDTLRELQAVCPRLGQSEASARDLAEWGARLDRELAERTNWALKIEKELEERTEWALRLHAEVEAAQKELQERTAWARRLESELEERTVWIQNLLDEIEANKSVAAWAHGLNAELERRNRQMAELRHHPFRFLMRFLRGRIWAGVRAKTRRS
jgi:SAM-dependent methyltransferase